MRSNQKPLLNDAASLVLRAGHFLTDDRSGRDGQQSKTGTANYVTKTDLAVQNFILSGLETLTPDFAVISEESSENDREFARPTWILDPVDGTSNLMFGLRHSAISLALWQDGGIQLAIVYNPYLDELFTAIAGQGAWLDGSRMQVSRRAKLSDALVGFGTTPYDRRHASRTFALTQKVFEQSFEVRRLGSAVLDLAYVACGRLDAFYERSLQPWDYAAGKLLVTEAGGRVSNWCEKEVSLQHADSVLATNALLHPPLLKLMASIPE